MSKTNDTPATDTRAIEQSVLQAFTSLGMFASKDVHADTITLPSGDKAQFHVRELPDAEFTDAENPCKGVRGYGEEGRDVYVEDDVYRAVWEPADQPLRDALDLAYLTGQRPSDALSMDRRDVRDGFLHISQSKTKHKLRIAVEGELAALLARFGARTFKPPGKQKAAVIVHTNLLLDERGRPLSKGQLRGRFDAARERAGVPKAAFQFRDLRAKAGTDKISRPTFAKHRNNSAIRQ